MATSPYTATAARISTTFADATEGFDVGGGDQPHLMAQLADLAAPEMRAATCLHRDDTRWQLAEKLQHLRAAQLLAQDRSTSAVGSVHLKHILRQIQPDRDNLRHDRSPLWILTDPPWHIDAVGGRSHHQSPGQRQNGATFFRQVELLEAVADWLLTSLQFELITIGARFVRHAHAITFQTAEVAVTGTMGRAAIAAIRYLRAQPSGT